jgi:uncharacterized membrane protein YsdA (DUF1294 family)
MRRSVSIKKKDPYLRGFIIWGFFLIVSTGVLIWQTELILGLQIFLAQVVATFLLFGFDKLQSQARGFRIPERILYLATFFGGSIGTIAGMYLFRHKTRKSSFQLIVWVLILVHVLFVVGVIQYLGSS